MKTTLEIWAEWLEEQISADHYAALTERGRGLKAEIAAQSELRSIRGRCGWQILAWLGDEQHKDPVIKELVSLNRDYFISSSGRARTIVPSVGTLTEGAIQVALEAMQVEAVPLSPHIAAMLHYRPLQDDVLAELRRLFPVRTP